MNFSVSLRMLILLLVVCCGIYPMLIWSVGQSMVPFTASGSLLTDSSGNIIGSRQIAQKFSQPQFFWPRLSGVDYDGAGAGGTNLSPTNPKVRERAQERLQALALTASVPSDLVTSSGSGLDPHITWGAALVQVPRVAAARGISEQEVLTVLNEVAEREGGPFLEEPLVNVLLANLALERK